MVAHSLLTRETDLIILNTKTMGIFNLLKGIFKSSDSKNSNGFPPGRPSRKDPPKERGWYRFTDMKTGEKKYVGITDDLSRRKSEHTRSGKFDSSTSIFEHKVVEKSTPYSALRSKEIAKINKYGGPSLNRNKGGGGRTPK